MQISRKKFGVVDAMNRKGIFLTFMVFLLIGAALALSVALNQSMVQEERNVIEESTFEEVNETFNNIYSQILEQREGYAGDAQKRYMAVGAAPGGGDSFTVSQQVPPPSTGATAQDAVDALNLFAIFVSDKGINQGLDIGAYVPDAFNAEVWGAGIEDPEVGFLIQPYCVRYLPLQVEDRFMGFEVPKNWVTEKVDGKCTLGEQCYEWGCELPFDIANVKSIDINFFVGKKTATCSDYINSEPNCQGSFSISPGVTCRTSYPPTPPSCGTAPCPKLDLNFMETYIEIPPQTDCFFKPPKPAPLCIRRVKGYLDPFPYNENSIKLQISSGSITIDLLDTDPSNPERVYLMSYNGSGVCLDNNTVVNITFAGPVGVNLAGFEFYVKKPGTDYCVRTAGTFCPGKAHPVCFSGPPAETRDCPLNKGVCAGVYQTCVEGSWTACNYGSSYQTTETGETRCIDGADNDCDGTADCSGAGGYGQDTSCCVGPSCVETSWTEAICNDGKDGDCDSKADCLDPDCTGKVGPGGGICQSGSEFTPVNRCSDGYDNDIDGTLDCGSGYIPGDSDCDSVCGY